MSLYSDIMAKMAMLNIGSKTGKSRNNRLDWSKHKRRKKDKRRAAAKQARLARRINRD